MTSRSTFNTGPSDGPTFTPLMRYQHIARYVASTLWAIDGEKWHDLLDVLAFRAAGHTFTPEDLTARLGSSRGSAPMSQSSGVAVVPMRGVIAHRMGSMDDSSGGTSAERIGAMLSQIQADDSIGTVVYDVDSPGGTVPGISELAAQMFALRGQKKQIAVVNGTMASAAYWLGSQADEIVSIPSGRAGSIGVFTAHEDLSGALEKQGIKVDLISAGKFKTEGNPFAPLTDEARAIWQDRVNAAYAQFTGDVARGRGVTAAAVAGGFGEGRALDAKDAMAAGMIDRIATMDQVLAELTGGSQADADRQRRMRIA